VSQIPPWFSPNWREIYAAALRQIMAVEKLAKAAGRQIRPPKDKP
jgi:hypothetical protein